MELSEKSDQTLKWLPSVKKPDFVGQIFQPLDQKRVKVKGSVQCNLCHQNSADIKIAILHLKTKHSDKKPYSCQNCDQRFNIKENLNIHKGKVYVFILVLF
jgi:transcription elongation factor Elf1